MYTIKVDAETFEQIRSGRRVYEYQINKGDTIRIGDHILYKKKPDLFDGVLVKVIDKKIYPSFLEMATILSIDELGFSGLTNLGVEAECHKIFSKELEYKHGVVVYEFQVTE